MKHRRFLLLVVALGTGCEESSDSAPSAPNARSQAVVSNERESAPSAALPAPPSAQTSAAPARRTQAVCAGQLERPGQALSKLTLGREVADSEPSLPEALPVGKGRWTWLNFWAAWCVPCREEIPRLKQWEGKLKQEGARFELVFVSLDDDPRQLTQFLAKQPAGGLKRTYWIKEGSTREEWFGALAMDPDPELPAHVLVDPKGLARCIVNGAIEDTDFPAVQKIVGG